MNCYCHVVAGKSTLSLDFIKKRYSILKEEMLWLLLYTVLSRNRGKQAKSRFGGSDQSRVRDYCRPLGSQTSPKLPSIFKSLHGEKPTHLLSRCSSAMEIELMDRNCEATAFSRNLRQCFSQSELPE